MIKKLSLLAFLSVSVIAAELNIYTARHYDADLELYKLFTKQTGITIKHTQAKPAELIKRLTMEGKNTPADIFITADVTNLNEAKEAGVLAAASSPILDEVIPKHLRDADKHWYAFTKRARIIAYDKNNKPDNLDKLKNYEDLTNPIFKGQIAMRSATAAYSKTLLSSIIANDGKDEAKKWAAGLLANMAFTPPKGSDRDQARRVIAGDAKYAIMNTYYVGLLATSKNPKDVKVGKSLGIIFPNQDNRGTHINVSGMALVKASSKSKEAIKFMEFLVSEEAQKMLTNINFEYPVRKGVEPAKIVKDLGSFKEDQLELSKIAENAKEAVRIYDEVGFR